MPMHCEIRIRGHLGNDLVEWFDGLSATNLDQGESVLSGTVPDQAALHGLLDRLRDLALPIVTIDCEPCGADSSADPSTPVPQPGH